MRSFMLLMFAVIVAGLAGSRAADAGWRTRGWGYGPVLNGQANLIRAQGQYQLSSAQASLEFEQAQALAIQNHKQAVETRWQLQDEWAARQVEKLSSHRASTETIARAASDAAPKRLSGAQFDRPSGSVKWPRALSTSTYAGLRTRVENQLRANEDDAPQRARATVEQFAVAVKNDVRTMPVRDYLAARKFLNSLAVTIDLEDGAQLDRAEIAATGKSHPVVHGPRLAGK